MNDERHRFFSRNHLGRTFLGMSMAIVLLFCNSVLISWGMKKLSLAIGWSPPPFLDNSLIFILTFLSISLEIQLVHLLHPRREDIFSQFIDAYRKISRGDYNIHVADENHGRFGSLTGGLNEMADSLKKMEKMRQQFISDMSHEIQSPLTSIRGFAGILKNEELDPEKRRAYLEIIEDESLRLSKLSEELLEMTKLESPDMKLETLQYSLNRQIRDVVLKYEPQWREKDLDVRVDLDESTICADRDLLVRVWNNLFHNAIKFTPPGKHIGISLHSDPETPETYLIIMSDEGIGIEEDEISFIFARFSKADKSRNYDSSSHGNGLGLSIVRKIVELHGGEVLARSSGLNRGTTFSVRLPVGWHE